MIKQDKIAFLQILTVFGTHILHLLDTNIKWEATYKKPTKQKIKFCIEDFCSKFKKMWILSHLLKNLLHKTSFLFAVA